MKYFAPVGTKFSHSGMTWIAEIERLKNPNTAIAQRVQVWSSKKTWLKLLCRYDIKRETIIWEVDRYSTSATRNGAAAMAASQTREALDAYVNRLASFGDENERKYAKMILKKKGHVNLIEQKEEVKW